MTLSCPSDGEWKRNECVMLRPTVPLPQHDNTPSQVLSTLSTTATGLNVLQYHCDTHTRSTQCCLWVSLYTCFPACFPSTKVDGGYKGTNNIVWGAEQRAENTWFCRIWTKGSAEKLKRCCWGHGCITELLKMQRSSLQRFSSNTDAFVCSCCSLSILCGAPTVLPPPLVYNDIAPHRRVTFTLKWPHSDNSERLQTTHERRYFKTIEWRTGGCLAGEGKMTSALHNILH